MMIASRCIYCKSPLTGRVPREHVIPYAFTHGFRGTNLCIRCVCSTCNHYFSRELEPALVKDSFLGLLRYLYGTKKDTRRGPLPPRSRFDLRYKGQALDVQPAPDGVGYQLKVVTQVGFPVPVRGGSYRYFRLDEIEAAISDASLDRSQAEIVESGPGALEQALATVARFGIQLKRFSRRAPVVLSPDLPQIEVHELQDALVKRCMAKIAFNYLAYVVQSKCHGRAEWIMSSAFDPVRHFVLGETQNSEPRFAKATVHRGKKGPFHTMALQWKRHEKDIVATIELFSWLCLQVWLVEDFEGVVWNITAGHCWDVRQRQVREMQAVRESLVPFHRPGGSTWTMQGPRE